MIALDVLAGRGQWAIERGDVLERLAALPDDSVNSVVTSPPYWGQRDYGVAGQIGRESTLDVYVDRMVAVFAEVRRVLRADGTCWVNLGDAYASHDGGGYRAGEFLNKNGRATAKRGMARNRAGTKRPVGSKAKDLIGIPWRVAFALQADGWWLRSDVIWAKPNPMPESATDRPTRSHEYLFLLTKAPRYFYDAEAIREEAEYGRRSNFRGGGAYLNQSARTSNGDKPSRSSTTSGSDPEAGRNKRTVWTIATEPYRGAHFATFPTALVEPCVLAGCPVGGVVLDPFCGSGTTLLVALRHGRRGIGIELSPAYCAMASRRIEGDCPMFNGRAG